MHTQEQCLQVESSSYFLLTNVGIGYGCAVPSGPRGGHLCGLVVRVPGYRFSVLDSIAGATILTKIWWVCKGAHSVSCGKVTALVYKTEN
jgi:hypothetical protein